MEKASVRYLVDVHHTSLRMKDEPLIRPPRFLSKRDLTPDEKYIVTYSMVKNAGNFSNDYEQLLAELNGLIERQPPTLLQKFTPDTVAERSFHNLPASIVRACDTTSFDPQDPYFKEAFEPFEEDTDLVFALNKMHSSGDRITIFSNIGHEHAGMLAQRLPTLWPNTDPQMRAILRPVGMQVNPAAKSIAAAMLSCYETVIGIDDDPIIMAMLFGCCQGLYLNLTPEKAETLPDMHKEAYRLLVDSKHPRLVIRGTQATPYEDLQFLKTRILTN